MQLQTLLWTCLQNNEHNKTEWSTVSWSTIHYLLSCWCVQSISSMFHLAANVVSLAASVSRALFRGLSFAVMGSRPIEHFCCASFFCPFLFFSIYSTASFVHWNVVFTLLHSTAFSSLMTEGSYRNHFSLVCRADCMFRHPPTDHLYSEVSRSASDYDVCLSPHGFCWGFRWFVEKKQNIFRHKLVIWWRTRQRPLGHRTRSCSVGQFLAALL